MVDCSCIRNISYLNVKIHYFLFNAALACVIPYFPVYAKEIGISAAAVGVIYSIIPVVTMVAKPLFGAIADQFNNLKTLMLVFLGIIVLSSVLIMSIPRKQTPISSEVLCTAIGTNLHFKVKASQDCTKNLSDSKAIKCYLYCTECVSVHKNGTHFFNSTPENCVKKVMQPAEVIVHLQKKNGSVQDYNVKDMTHDQKMMNTLCFVNQSYSCTSICEPVLQECFTGKQEPEYSSDQFWLFLIFTALCVSLCGVTTSFSDAICFNELGQNGHLYGKQRLWGTIGWGLLSPVAGFFNDFVTGDSFLKAYQPGALMHVMLVMYDVCLARKLMTKNLKCSQSIFKDIGSIIRRFKMIAFILSVSMIGAFTALLWSYLFWHLISLKGNKILLGLVPAVQCFAGEFPFFFFSGVLIKGMGHFNILTVNFIGFGLRFIAYSYLKNPWLVLPIELIQGPTYGLFYATMASFAHVAALPGTEVTVQGLVGSAFELDNPSRLYTDNYGKLKEIETHDGMVVGNILSGISMQNNGGSFTFFWAGVISLCYCLLHVILSFIVKYIDKKEALRAQEEAAPPEENVSFM